MKKFDLEAAKRGAAVCMRNGKQARIICVDANNSLFRIVAMAIDNVNENVRLYEEDGGWISSAEECDKDLVMRDDDYLEKLERGEYDHIADVRKMVGTTIKQNLNTDREYWRRMYAGQVMQGIFAGRNWRSGEMIPDCIGYARNAVELADALIEELEKR